MFTVFNADSPGLTQRKRGFSCCVSSSSVLEKEDIAALSNGAIKSMPLEELGQFVESAERLFANGRMFRRIADRDRAVLEQVLMRARRCCRAQGY